MSSISGEYIVKFKLSFSLIQNPLDSKSAHTGARSGNVEAKSNTNYTDQYDFVLKSAYIAVNLWLVNYKIGCNLDSCLFLKVPKLSPTNLNHIFFIYGSTNLDVIDWNHSPNYMKTILV